MFCPQCGTGAEEHYRFCSKCGAELSGVPKEIASGSPRPRNMETHVQAVGWLFMATGIITGIFGAFMMVLGRFIPGVLGAMPDIQRDLPLGVTGIAGAAIVAIGLVTLATAVAIFMAGYGLLQYRPWARVATIVGATLLLMHFPFGTALGIYALWVFLSEDGRQFYERKAVHA